jgi:hypothetical protein
LEARSVVDENNPEYKVCFLFFEEKNQMYLLLGRKEHEDSDRSSCSSGSGSCSSEMDDLADSEKLSQDEEDDDSPYFVKITLDPKFLAHLEEPSLTGCQEIKKERDVPDAVTGEVRKVSGYDTLLAHVRFKEIIQRELEMMFPPEKTAKPPKPMSDEGELNIPPTAREPSESSAKDSGSLSSAGGSGEQSQQDGTSIAKFEKEMLQFDTKLRPIIKNFSMVLNVKPH